jgi:GNAT superfamily N-acetyltransferase
MQIRLVKRNEYDQLLGLMRQLNPLDKEASEIEFHAFNEIINSKYLDLIVAEDGGILLGSCYLNVIPNITRGGRSYALIENVVTDSAHRNRGIGKSLIDHAVELAWAQNCYKVMLMSGRAETAVHAFYKKCGFNADEKQAYIQRAP